MERDTLMTDKELLELAAKSAGIECVVSGGQLWTTLDGSINKWTERWNPLANDGQALRLAVSLMTHIEFSVQPNSTKVVNCVEKHNDDPYAATRRAIVRAAADIGKGMK